MQKIIFFDLDGTLLPENSWHLFNMAFGVTKEEDTMIFDWCKKGIISYKEWNVLITKIIRLAGLCTQEKVIAFAKTITPRPESQDIIKACKELGYKTILLSGAMKQLAQSVADRLGIDECYTTSNIIFTKDGDFINIENDGDESRITKVEIFERVCKENGVDPRETLTVGDGGNDMEMFKVSKKAILLGNYAPLKQFAWKQTQSLSEIRELL